MQALECLVCMQRYNEEGQCPRLLSCGHSFCSSCLQLLLKGDRINCPQDRKEVLVLEGVNSLPKNYALLHVMQTSPNVIDVETITYCEICDIEKHVAESYCEDCGQAMCQAMSDVHIKMRASKHHKIVPVSQVEACSSAVACCAEHNLPYSCFDKDCEIPICAACFSQNHSLHNCQSLGDAAAACRSNIEILFDELQAKVTQVQASTDSLVSIRRGLDKNHQDASCELEKAFEVILKTAAAKKEELSAKLKGSFQCKSAAIDERMKSLNSLRTSLDSAVDQATLAMHLDKDLPFLLAYNQQVSRISKLTDCAATWVSSSVDDLLAFSGNSSDITSRIETFACIFDDGSQFEVKGAGLVYAFSGCDGTFSVRKATMGNAASGPTTIPIKVVVKEKVVGRLSANVTERGDVFDVSYPGIRNVTEMMVSVLVCGSHIKGSPFLVPNFFAKVQNLKALNMGSYEWIGTRGSYGWAESVSLKPSTRKVELDVSYDLTSGEYPNFTIVFFDERDEGKSAVDVCGWSHEEYIPKVLVRSQSKEKVSGVYRLSLDCKTQICGINESFYSWYGFLKLGFLLLNSGKFTVKLVAFEE